MRTWTSSLAVAVCGALATVAVAGDDSGYIWQSGSSVRQVGAAAPAPRPPQETRPLGGPASSQTAAVAEDPNAPPAPLPATSKPAAPTATGKAKESQPGRLPEDPAYAPLPAKPSKSPFWEEAPPAPPLALPPTKLPSQSPSPADACQQEQCEADSDTPCRLLGFPALDNRRIDVRGWIDQGFTWNPQNPNNRFNGPVAYNDRSNEYQLNQVYLIAERVAKPEDGCWDVGGRVDLLYGTDHRFPMARGLDDEWNSGRFYGLALPQMYADVAYDKWLLRAGHFLAPVGYESVMAPENFFYSHSYDFLYGEPTTLSGGMLRYTLTDWLSINGGLDNGWNNWTNPNGKLGYFTGFNVTSRDKRANLSMEFFFNNQQLEGKNTRFQYDLVASYKVTDKWTYAFEHNFGVDPNAVFQNGQREDAHWYGFCNYLFYELNKCWSFGLRYEYYNDQDGLTVVGLGSPHGINLNGVPSDWQDISVGLNYKPNLNVTMRSEVRWDWVDPQVAVSDGPFDDFNKRGQFLWGMDLIVKF